jgi:signal transduction histidine kinase
MSHELRTPLNIIMGYEELLCEGALGPLNAEQLGALQRSGRASHQLLDLVNTVLDVGLLEAETPNVAVDTVDLRELLAEIETDTEAARSDKPLLVLRVEVSPAVEAPLIDRARLKVVLRKVIDNAIEFTDKGTVTVDAHPHNDGIEIAVTDTGIGITAEVLAVMFQSFRQGERALTRRHGGIGLGLHVVRRLLDALGGRITVVSAPGQGSTFTVWVPSAGLAPARRLSGRAA